MPTILVFIEIENMPEVAIARCKKVKKSKPGKIICNTPYGKEIRPKKPILVVRHSYPR